MTNLQELQSIAPQGIWDGVISRSLQGEQLTLAIVELEPNSHVPEHHHPNEQMGVVITGSLRFRVGDETKEFGPGGTWRILGNVPHEVWTGPDGAVLVEAFAPRRADWDEKEAAPDRPPRWP